MWHRDYEALVRAALPATRSELVRALKVGRSTVQRWVDAMHGPLCHVGSWRNWQPVYHAGPGVDAPCNLVKLTSAETSKRYRANPDVRARVCAKASARHWSRKARANGDPLVNALFGKVK